jgi:hypothetical protein
MVLRDHVRTLCALASLICLGSAVGAGHNPHSSRIAQAGSRSADSDEGDECVDCHQQEVEGFARSKMAQSMSLPALEPKGTVRVTGTTIEMYSDKQGSWQRLESHGETENYRVDYVIGSGTHAKGFIISLANHLFQSPVAYYRRRAAYGLAPGFENEADPDFTRPIEPGCLFCHSGSFAYIPGTQNEYNARPFSQLAIRCSRCHGPVYAHLRNPSASNIVDPDKLEPAARDSICEQCHLKGVARVLNPGKQFADFVPGQPLEKTFTIYRYAMPKGTEPPFKVISHAEQLAMSHCKRASGDGMWCGTCHDPHNEPTDPITYYRAKCLVCHAQTHFAAEHPSRSSNCIGCHMPKKEANDGGHTVFTDHRIQRPGKDSPAGEPIGITPWRDPPAELAERNLGIASIQAGMEQGNWPQVISGYRTLVDVQHQFPNDGEMYKSIGAALFVGRQYSEAAIAFELAVRSDPQSSTSEASLGSVYVALGDKERAEEHLKQALNLDPLNLAAAESLIGLYEQGGEPAKAEEVRRKIAMLMP